MPSSHDRAPTGSTPGIPPRSHPAPGDSAAARAWASVRTSRADPIVKTLATWWRATRPYSFTASATPVLVGSAVAARTGQFSPLLFAVTLVASVAIHAGTNMINDYYDHVRGVDTPESIGPGGAIQRGLLSPDAVRAGGLALLGLGSVLGLWLVVVGRLADPRRRRAERARGLHVHGRPGAVRVHGTRRPGGVHLHGAGDRTRRLLRADARRVRRGPVVVASGRRARHGDSRRQQPPRSLGRPRAGQAHARDDPRPCSVPAPNTRCASPEPTPRSSRASCSATSRCLRSSSSRPCRSPPTPGGSYGSRRTRGS